MALIAIITQAYIDALGAVEEYFLDLQPFPEMRSKLYAKKTVSKIIKTLIFTCTYSFICGPTLQIILDFHVIWGNKNNSVESVDDLSIKTEIRSMIHGIHTRVINKFLVILKRSYIISR